jgi:peptide-methionine (S)-S-oxide reductase
MPLDTRKDPIPAPLHDLVAPESGWEAGQTNTAIFAGGCFWGVQSVFQRVRGVLHTVVGYTGGAAETANYRAVCTQDTGHAEAIEIVYDPAKVSYGTLLRIFFSVVHDPTQMNRQGGDVGPSYRSAIFTTGDDQRRVALDYIHQLDQAGVFPKKIVTQVSPLEIFYAGEDYHQDYALKNPHNPYIQVCDIPKIGALERQFPELFQEYSLQR